MVISATLLDWVGVVEMRSETEKQRKKRAVEAMFECCGEGVCVCELFKEKRESEGNEGGGREAHVSVVGKTKVNKGQLGRKT